MVEAWVVGLAVWQLLCMAGAVLWLDHRLGEALDELDGNLAAAIKGVIEAARGSLEGAEPFNPIQAAIAQWIAGQVGAPRAGPDVSLLDRSPEGQFQSPKPPKVT